MNRLAIARLINTLAGTQGTVDTTEGQSGYQATLVTFLDQAYNDIQVFRDNWLFMRQSVSVPLNVSLATYSNDDIADVTRVYYNKRELRYVYYDKWVLQDHATGEPREYTVNPATNELTFNPSDATYLVTLDYQRVPDIMTTNSAIPILPVRFHNIIAFKALIDLGAYLGNPDIISKYTQKYNTDIGTLMRSQVPMMYLKTSPLV